MSLVLRLVSLTLVYALALASFHPWDLAAGLALSAACLLALRGLTPDGHTTGRELLRRLARFPLLAVVVLRDVITGTWRVALIALGVRPLGRPGLVEVPLDGRSRAGVAATGIVGTLPPGDVFVDVDWGRGVMLVHALDADDPAAVRERYRHFYERYQRGVFP